MLLTKETDYKVNCRSIKYYREKGYDCNINDIIKVKVEDLKSGSLSLIKYQCDRCNTIVELTFKSFSAHHNIRDKTYCGKCSNILKRENININKLKYLAFEGYKVCTLCERKLPADSDHFNLKCDTKDGFTNWCKECSGRKFTNNLTRKPKDGYKFCKKCNRELPVNSLYFPTDNSCVDGTRNVCRECNKNYGHFLDKMPHKSEAWSDSDLKLLESIYADYTNEELVEYFFPNRTKRSLESMADLYGFSGKSEETYKRSCISRGIKCSKKLKGRTVPDEVRQKQSIRLKEYYKTHDGFMKGKTFSEEHRKSISLRQKGKWSGENNPKYNVHLNGELNPNWKGGITSLYQELRSDTKQWFIESAKFCNYKCVITGGQFDNVHHLYPFKDIVEEIFNTLNIEKRKNISQYTVDEEHLIREELKRLHSFYGFGVPLHEKVHKLFHDEYGYTNIGYLDFISFVSRIKSGEFSKWFEDNNLAVDINYNFIEYIKNKIKEVV